VAVVRRIACTVQRVIDHGERVYSVELAPSLPVPRFRPGQFLHLALDAADRDGFWPESRVFSIASSPDERDRLAITYAVKGPFTSRMERELAPGGPAWVKLPYGEFFVDPTRDAVLFAGGTGVTAFTAFVGSLTSDHDRRVQLYYGARTGDLFVYGDLALDRAREIPALTSELINQETDGRLSVDRAWPTISTLDSPLFYLSGPPVMIRALWSQLRAHGVADHDIRTDEWE
jgi:ferredoxin-NADP reductase